MSRAPKIHRYAVATRGNGVESRTPAQVAAAAELAARIDAAGILAPATAVGLPRPTATAPAAEDAPGTCQRCGGPLDATTWHDAPDH